MTSAFLVSWAEDGLKVLLGRQRPAGLGPSGPGKRSLLKLPGLKVVAPSNALGPHSGPTGRVTLKAQKPFILMQPGKRARPPPLKRTPRLAAASPARALAAGRRCGFGRGAGVRSSSSIPTS
jgi:hypothetical protein